MNTHKKLVIDNELLSQSTFVNILELTSETTRLTDFNGWKILVGGKPTPIPTAGTAPVYDEATYPRNPISRGSNGQIYFYYDPTKQSTGQTNILLDTPTSSQLADKIKQLFRSARGQVFEDGVDSDFSKELVSIIESDGALALEIIKNLVGVGSLNNEVLSEALRWIGSMEDEKSHVGRRQLLEESLSSESSKVRDGATIGLSYLGDPQAIGYLKRAAKREQNGMLHDFMLEVIEELQA